MDISQYQKLEFLPSDQIAAVQEKLLQQHVRYCAEHSPFYRRIFARRGVSPDHVTLNTLSGLPLTGKEDLAADNDAFLAVPEEDVIDIVFSSGTTGIPTKIAYTEHDLARLAYNEHQAFAGTGMAASDTVLLTCTMDRCFVAGLAYYLGARSLGASTIRNGHGTMDGHCEIIRRESPTVIVGVPSFLVKLAEYMQKHGLDPRTSSVRKLICIGEPVRDRCMAVLPAGRALQELWGAAVYSTYASSETVTTFCECEQECGGHARPELAVVEIVDEEGENLPAGEVGEVVITPLGSEGMPLLRFQTGDLSFLLDEPCTCLRNTPRLGPILARKKQMIKLKGTTLYPQAVARALDSIPAVAEHYIEISRNGELSDGVTVCIAVTDPEWTAQRIGKRLQSRLRVTPKIVLAPVEQVRERVFSPEYRKPMRFFDRRTS